jgi:hypothetical protein
MALTPSALGTGVRVLETCTSSCTDRPTWFFFMLKTRDPHDTTGARAVGHTTLWSLSDREAGYGAV